MKYRSEGEAQDIRSLKEQVASLQGDLALLRQQGATRQSLSTEARSSPQFDDTFNASRSRLISPDYTDPGSNAARPEQTCPSIEPSESHNNCQPSASYTFNISLARAHLQAQGIAMTDSDRQGSSLSAHPTRSSSPSIYTPLELGVGSVDPMWLIDEKEAIRLCNLFEAEIGSQYPFLNMSKIIDDVRGLYRAMATGSQNGFAFTAMPGPTVIDPLDLDLIKMVISTGSVVEAGGASQLGKALFLGVRKASLDKLWESAGIKNTMLFVLLVRGRALPPSDSTLTNA